MPDCSIPSPNLSDTPSDPGWQARLTLGFGNDAGTTRLLERSHSGPLRVQKPLYPEGGAVCHVIVVHPPGGVVGGDQLRVHADTGDHARSFLTSPGATKWYKANGKQSRQQVSLQAGAGASVEWMPQESIFFDQANVALRHEVTLAADASYIGCEILCLGRRASGETFNTGRISQHTSIRRGGKLLWWEQGSVGGAVDAVHGPILHSVLGWSGRSVSATLIAVGKLVPAALLEAVRARASGDAASEAGARVGATYMKPLLVVRYLGDDSEVARRVMLGAWQLLRPHLLEREPPVLRSWNT